ncbi:MAG: hypothetical protein V7K26_05975 [Nostoc sp.]|uniref:hypothetical protein n=1 Tax=Nostoc sp. TaxID=1180 RepID=UPI002FF0E302
MVWSLSVVVPLRGSKLRAASRREVQPLAEKGAAVPFRGSKLRAASRREVRVRATPTQMEKQRRNGLPFAKIMIY